MATFSYSFDIAPWVYSNPTSLNPDSPDCIRALDDAGGAAWDDEVQTEAANPDGIGRGFIHYVGDGTNSVGNGCRFQFGSTYTDMYARYYAKFPSNMSFTGGYWKDIDFQYGSGDRMIFGYQNNVWQFINTERFADVPNSDFYCGNGTKTWASLMNNANGTGDDLWHRFEFHIRAGNGDGLVEIRIDGVDVGSESGLVTDSTVSGWSGFNFSTNQSSISGFGGGTEPYKIYFDELVVTDTGWVGPIAAGSPIIAAYRNANQQVL